jgi:hypothetical protein
MLYPLCTDVILSGLNGEWCCWCAGIVLVNVGFAVSSSSTLRFANQTYTATVAEHSPRGTRVLTVYARVNGTSPAVYSLGAGDDVFSIDAGTGELLVTVGVA